MGDLGDGTGSAYPGALDTDTTQESTATTARADVPNDSAAAIIAIETELGTDPAGTATNVKTFLQVEHNTGGTHDSALIVMLAGAQTITGDKMFSGTTTLDSAVVTTGEAIISSKTAPATPTANALYKDNMIKAWVRFDGETGAVATIKSDYNVSGVTRNSIGNYTITFATAMADANYAVIGSGAINVSPSASLGYSVKTITMATGSCTVVTESSGSLIDLLIVSILVVGLG